jgi:alpha-galactosidase
MNQATRDILLNPEVVAVNQDVMGAQGYRVGRVLYAYEAADVYAKPLADGSIAVGLFNLGERSQRQIAIGWESLGLHPERECLIRDLWVGEDIGRFRTSYSVAVDSHQVQLIRITPLL